MIFYSIRLHFVIQEWWWNDRMRGNEVIFLNQGKTLDSETHLIPQSFGHSIFEELNLFWMSLEWRKWLLNDLICCCLFRRDSTILNHSEVISVILVHSISKDLILFWMSLEWKEWPLNDLICCCLFRRDSTILNHSEVISVNLASFLIQFLKNSFFSEWVWNERNDLWMI